MSVNILLRPEQKELLLALVKADQSQDPDKREPFFAVQAMASTYLEISHPKLPGGKIKAYMGDYDALIREKLIWVNKTIFEVSPLGLEYCKQQ
jgi:hypothetical protein